MILKIFLEKIGTNINIYSLSSSSFNTYSDCEWKFFLTYLLKFPDEGSPSTALGHLAHKVLEILAKASKLKHDKKSKVWDIEWLMKTVYNHYTKKVPHLIEGIDKSKLKKVGNAVRSVLNTRYTPIKDNIIDVENYFSLMIERPEFLIGDNQYLKINGFIDRIDQIDEDTIEIIDWKSGKGTIFGSTPTKRIDPEYLREMIQPQIYNLAAKKLYPQFKNIIVTFYYLVDGGPITTFFDDIDIKRTEDIISRRLRAVKANLSPQRNLSWKCRFCQFSEKKGNICEQVWQEKEENGLEFTTNKYITLNYKKK